MKKSLLALAVLGAFAGAASAQSTVTLYGRVDLSVGQQIGQEAKFLSNGSGSRLGVRGVEDLGGGLKALFNIEHRFEADTGVVGSGASGGTSVTAATPTGNPRFWHGRSIVGLEGGFGRVWLGREYTPAFLASELLSDPWGFDTVGQISVGLGTGAVRNDSTINYQIGFGGFTGWVQVGEGTDTFTNTPDRKIGFALSYGAGPLYAAWGYDDQGGVNDKWNHFTLNWDFGAFKLWTGFGTGKNNADLDVQTWQVAATMPIGGGELRVGYGQREDDLPAALGGGTLKVSQKAAIGYHYAMSKRTTIYADVANDSKTVTPIGDPKKTGYDFGVKHNF